MGYESDQQTEAAILQMLKDGMDMKRDEFYFELGEQHLGNFIGVESVITRMLESGILQFEPHSGTGTFSLRS